MCPRVAFSEHGWGNFTLKAAGANLGHFVAKFENGRDQMISGGFEGNLIYCRLKFWRQSRQNAHNGRAKLAVFASVLRYLQNGVRKRGLSFLWSQRIENHQKKANVQAFVMMSR